MTVERETPLVHMTRRAPLDLALAEAARAAGAVLEAPCAVARALPEPDHVRLETDAGPIRARTVPATESTRLVRTSVSSRYASVSAESRTSPPSS